MTINDNIRIATASDRDGIESIHLKAFPDAENRLVADLAVELLATDSTPPTLAFVTEVESKLVAHVAFSPVALKQYPQLSAYMLAPLAVDPSYQKHGLGTRLVEYGIDWLTQQGVELLLVYGDPGYYQRFGFRAEAAKPLLPPYPLEYTFGWLARYLGKQVNELQTETTIHCVEAFNDPKLW